MTEQQLKQLAEIALLNVSIMTRLASGFGELLEQVLPLLPVKERALSLLSDLEQLQSALTASRESLAQVRKELGLE